MKVTIQVHGEGEYNDDTLSSRMVDARIEELAKEFRNNHIPVNIIRDDDIVLSFDEQLHYNILTSWGHSHNEALKEVRK